MIEDIIIAGAGGQGVMLLGKVLSETAMLEEKFVTWLPCYGAEVRGGTANCMVVVSDSPIGSPYIEKADTLIIMNSPSLERFKGRLNKRGLMLVNSSLAHNIPDNKYTRAYPFTDIALELGNVQVANMVALGAYVAHRKIVKPQTVIRAMEEIAPADKKKLVAINTRAFEKGFDLSL